MIEGLVVGDAAAEGELEETDVLSGLEVSIRLCPG